MSSTHTYAVSFSVVYVAQDYFSGEERECTAERFVQFASRTDCTAIAGAVEVMNSDCSNVRTLTLPEVSAVYRWRRAGWVRIGNAE